MPIPTRDEDGLADLAWYLKDKKHTVEDITDKFNLSVRTAYRWLEYLREDYLIASVKENGGTYYTRLEGVEL
jgi:predicted DNA-binding transcriptional regulator YafY